VYYPQ